MSNIQSPIPSPEAITSAWDDVFQVAYEVPGELIGAGDISVDLGVFRDHDPESGREVTVEFDEQGRAVKFEVAFSVGASERRGGRLHGGIMRCLILDQDGLEIKYDGGHDAMLLVREAESVRFGGGIGEQRKRQALGYLGIIGDSVRDSIERSMVEA